MYKEVFKMPKATTINARSSSITNAFINGVIPCINPSETEVKEALEILGMNNETIRCAYCGEKSTQWDHFRPLVKNKKATGYISEIANLVPSCGTCNSSKGNRYWKEWIYSDAKKSPKKRHVEDLESKVTRLEAYESWATPTWLDMEEIIGTKKWGEYWAEWENILNTMKMAQDLSNEIKKDILQSVSDAAK